ncbi:MAG: ATP-binding protein [Xanthobacteraceae bacterium]
MKLSRHRLIPFLKVLLAASIAVPALLFAFFAWHSYQTAMQTAHDRADRFAAIVGEHALKVFETISMTLENVDYQLQSATWDQIRSSRTLWERLRLMQDRAEEIGAIFVTPREGSTALTTRVFPAPPLDFSDRDYFVDQKEHDRGFYIGHAYVGKISGDPIFNFSIRKTSPTGQFDGIIGVSAYVSYFHRYYQTIGIAADDFAMMLLREDGQVLVRYPAVARPVAIDPQSELPRLLRNGDKGSFRARSPIDGVARIFGYSKAGSYPVYAVYGIDRAAITWGWLRAMIPGAIIALVAAISLFSLCWFALRSAQQQQQFLHALDNTNQRLRSEMQLRERAEASLMQTQRLEAVGQLTGGIAHDFNNLLMIISGNLELAERQWNDTHALKRKLKAIRYATDRAKSLTQQLLGFARRHTPAAETVDLNDALEKARALIAYSLPENIKLNFALSVERCPVRVDVSEFEAAILNLVGNARDAMPAGGTLTISTTVTAPSTDENGSKRKVELRVTDTGQGMPPDVLQRVFEPFFTTKETGKGTGLGLSQVYGFAQQSDGSVTIVSEIGKGTCVAMSFPRSGDATVEVERVRSSFAHQGEALTILVVENQPEVRQVSTAMLEDLGHQVLVARNAAEALALLHAGYPIDVLFADVILSEGISGLDLAEQAVASFPALKVLLTTGHPGRADLLRHNEFAILAKPYTRDGLASALEAFNLSRSRLRAGGEA